MNKIKQRVSNFLKSFKLSGLPAILGLLGAWGGQQNKWVRRIIIPLIFTICALIELRSLWCLFIFTQIGFLSIGYGIPDKDWFDDSMPCGDKGSSLGRFWYKIWKGNITLTNVFTRGIIGLGIALSFLVVPVLKWNWLVYLLGSCGITLVWALISWQGFGSFKVKLFGKELECLKVDFVVYSFTGLLGLLIIYK